MEANFVLKIAGQTLCLDKPIPGKNPIWNKIFTMYVKIDQNLEFASNIIITFTNRHPSKQKWWSNNSIGDICLSALSAKQETKETPPNFQFYHIVNQG